MGIKEMLLEPIGDKLRELDLEFARELRSPIPIIAEINSYIARTSGKRIRPTLLLLASRMLGYQGKGDVAYAAVIEFIHTATLIHDDIIDNASLRRGLPSVNVLWGNNVTVLLGDYLYLKSMEMALTQKSLEALAFHQFHGDVVDAVRFANVVDHHNVGMREEPCGARFRLETLY